MSALLEACAGAGVREFCVCAGARNVALVVALERSSGCRVWHFFDERAAAFFALGRMMKTGAPVAVVTTSGTAVAELLPATIEAYYQSLPLVLLTADRPARFRATGAPQAIEQVEIFSGYARCLDVGGEAPAAAAECVGFLERAIRQGRPAHLNLCLEEPQAEEIEALGGVTFSDAAQVGRRGDGLALLEVFLEEPDGLLVMLGNLREDERCGLPDFLRRLGAPVLAEAGSGQREKLPGLVVRDVPDGVRKVLRHRRRAVGEILAGSGEPPGRRGVVGLARDVFRIGAWVRGDPGGGLGGDRTRAGRILQRDRAGGVGR